MRLHHQEKHFQASTLLRDLVIGMSDGLTVPFALAAGLTAAASGNGIILTAGVAELVAGAISMGVGGYLAGKTDLDHYRGEMKREYREVELIPEEEKQEVRDVFSQYGLSDRAKDLIVDELSKDKDQWVEFMMRFELGLEKPDQHQASRSALSVGGSYALGGLIPLAPYLFTPTPQAGLKVSALVTLIALGIFGYTKSRLTGQPKIPGALRVMLTGGIAASSAYFIAKIAKFG